jgi:hypothetical protein
MLAVLRFEKLVADGSQELLWVVVKLDTFASKPFSVIN